MLFGVRRCLSLGVSLVSRSRAMLVCSPLFIARASCFLVALCKWLRAAFPLSQYTFSSTCEAVCLVGCCSLELHMAGSRQFLAAVASQGLGSSVELVLRRAV